MEKESIFRRPPERKSEGDYFLDAFPDMPDKAGLYDAMDAISFMSDDAFIYYLPFLMVCLLEDPYPYDRLGDSTAYLTYMTREGFAYFLPGYMTMCIRDDPREIDFIMLSLYLKLTHPDSPPAEEKGWMYDYQKKRFDGFVKFLSLPQKECVALFLRHQLTHWGEQEVPEEQADPDIKRAYEGYWYQFDPERKEPPLPSPNPQ